MTREDIKTITDIVHKTIYGFFDVCGDDEETPITDKDELLLSINKAICSNIKALEQKPCSNAIDRDKAIWIASGYCHPANVAKELAKLPPVQPKTVHCRDCKWWKDSDGVFRRGIGAESQCPMNRIEVYEGNGYCYMFEPKTQEVEE